MIVEISDERKTLNSNDIVIGLNQMLNNDSSNNIFYFNAENPTNVSVTELIDQIPTNISLKNKITDWFNINYLSNFNLSCVDSDYQINFFQNEKYALQPGDYSATSGDHIIYFYLDSSSYSNIFADNTSLVLATPLRAKFCVDNSKFDLSSLNNTTFFETIPYLINKAYPNLHFVPKKDIQDLFELDQDLFEEFQKFISDKVPAARDSDFIITVESQSSTLDLSNSSNPILVNVKPSSSSTPFENFANLIFYLKANQQKVDISSGIFYDERSCYEIEGVADINNVLSTLIVENIRTEISGQFIDTALINDINNEIIRRTKIDSVKKDVDYKIEIIDNSDKYYDFINPGAIKAITILKIIALDTSKKISGSFLVQLKFKVFETQIKNITHKTVLTFDELGYKGSGNFPCPLIYYDDNQPAVINDPFSGYATQIYNAKQANLAWVREFSSRTSWSFNDFNFIISYSYNYNRLWKYCVSHPNFTKTQHFIPELYSLGLIANVKCNVSGTYTLSYEKLTLSCDIVSSYELWGEEFTGRIVDKKFDDKHSLTVQFNENVDTIIYGRHSIVKNFPDLQLGAMRFVPRKTPTWFDGNVDTKVINEIAAKNNPDFQFNSGIFTGDNRYYENDDIFNAPIYDLSLIDNKRYDIVYSDNPRLQLNKTRIGFTSIGFLYNKFYSDVQYYRLLIKTEDLNL